MGTISIEEAADIIYSKIKPVTFGDISKYLEDNFSFSQEESWEAFKSYLKKHHIQGNGDFGTIPFEEDDKCYIDYF